MAATLDRSGGVSFRAHERHDDDLGPLLVTIQRRIEALLNRRGMSDSGEGFDAPDRWAGDTPALAGLAAASVRGVTTLGPRAGTPVRRWGDTIEAPDPPPIGRWHAREHGFDLHAGIVVPAGSRDRLERWCRYALRPPVGQDRLQLTPDGKAVLELRRRWTDGTTHLVFDPVELLERLAALTTRPRITLPAQVTQDALDHRTVLNQRHQLRGIVEAQQVAVLDEELRDRDLPRAADASAFASSRCGADFAAGSKSWSWGRSRFRARFSGGLQRRPLGQSFSPPKARQSSTRSLAPRPGGSGPSSVGIGLDRLPEAPTTPDFAC